METIYKKTGIKESEYTLRITHKIIGEQNKPNCPLRFSDDDDISDILSLYENEKEITIYVVLEPRKRKGICVANDDDGRNLDVGGRCFVDDYFGLHILENDNVENEASQNLLPIGGVNPIYHPPQICRGIRDNNEVICSNPTPNNLSDQTPGDGFDVEGNDSRPQSPRQVYDQFVDDQNTTSQQFDWAEENIFRSYSSGDGRHDGSDFALGQHFESKEDLDF